jgi:uroporphyrinogen-III synthase
VAERPLEGLRIVVTRPPDQAEVFADEARSAGARLVMPLVASGRSRRDRPCCALADLDGYD